MMTGRKVDDTALEWAIRTADPSFEDWDGLTEWLEADPLNHDRYDEATAAIAQASDRVAATPVQAAPVVANDTGPMRRGYWRWGGGAIAAMLAVVVGVSVWNDRSQPYAVETSPGEQRSVALADGSQIILSGGSRVTLDRADARVAVVDRGEMLFRIRHDAAHPFQVTAGDTKMVDLGTVFDVTHDPRRTRVAVAEGAVMVDPQGARLRLDPGQAVVDRGEMLFRIRHDAAHPFQVTAGDTKMVDLGTVFDVTHDPRRTRVAVAEGAVMVDPQGARLRLDPGQAVVASDGELRRERAEDVGGWREGRVTFDHAPLSDVARDLSRQLGHDIRVDAAIADRPFSGTVDIRSLNDDPALLGRLLAVGVRRDGEMWVLGDDR